MQGFEAWQPPLKAKRDLGFLLGCDKGRAGPCRTPSTSAWGILSQIRAWGLLKALRWSHATWPKGCRRLRHRWSREKTSGPLAGICHRAAFPAEGRQVGRWKRCPLPAPGCPRCPHSPRGHPLTHGMPEPCPGSSPTSFFIPHDPKSILFLLMHLNPKTAFGHPKEHSRGR